MKQELDIQRKRLTEQAAAERRMLEQQFESKLESQQVVELAQAAAAQQALRCAELVQSQLSERVASLSAEVRVVRVLPIPFVRRDRSLSVVSGTRRIRCNVKFAFRLIFFFFSFSSGSWIELEKKGSWCNRMPPGKLCV